MTRKVWLGMACLLATATLLLPPPFARAALGRKIDNYLNHNLPFAELEYTCTISGEVGGVWHPDQQDPCNNIIGCNADGQNNAFYGSCDQRLTFEFYDTMTAEEKIRVDSNHQMETALGYVGSFVTGYSLGGAAASLGRNAATALGMGTVGQWLSGAFGSGMVGVSGDSAGSW